MPTSPQRVHFRAEQGAAPAFAGGRRRRPARRARAQRPLRCFANLDKTHAPVLRDPPRRQAQAAGVTKKSAQSRRLTGAQAKALVEHAREKAGAAAGHKYDVWDDAPEDVARVAAESGKRRGTYGAVDSTKTNREVARPALPAVMVDPAGCSYNPDEEQRQDAVAVAVAAEVTKQLKKEVFQGVGRAPRGGHMGSIEAGTMDIVHSGQGALPGEGSDDDDGESEGEEDDTTAAAAAKRAPEKLTRAQRNKKRRAADAAKEAELAKAAKRQRHELSQLGALSKQLKRDEREREEARTAAAEARAARAVPLRVGKEVFEDMPVQVLTEDETHRPLRRLKPCPAVVVDRFKGLQRSGAIEPRSKRQRRRKRATKTFIKGAKGEKEEAGHHALQAQIALRKAKKKAPQLAVKG